MNKQSVIDKIERSVEVEHRSDDGDQFSDEFGEYTASEPKHDILFGDIEHGILVMVRFVQDNCIHIVAKSNGDTNLITLGVDEFESMADKELLEAVFMPIYLKMESRMGAIKKVRDDARDN